MRSIRSWTIAARSACAALAGAAPTAAAPPALGNGSSMQPDILATGRFVVFASTATSLAPNDTGKYPEIFIRDRVAGTTRLDLQGGRRRRGRWGQFVAGGVR